MIDLGATALAGDDTDEAVGDDFGADVVRDAEGDDLAGEGGGVAVGVP